MPIGKLLIKPAVNLSKGQWKKLLGRIFDREQKGAGDVAKYIGKGKMGMAEGLPTGPRPSMSNTPMPPKEVMPRSVMEEGHVAGGGLRGPWAKYDLEPNPVKATFGTYEPKPAEMRGMRRDWKQSEEMARSVAELKGGGRSKYKWEFDEEQEVRKMMAEIKARKAPLKARKPTPSKKGSLKERRGIRSSVFKPDATLVPKQMRGVEKGGHLPTGAELMSIAPPSIKKYGRILERSPEGIDRPKSLPWHLAAQLVDSDPKRYIPATGSFPAVDMLKLKGKGGSSYERRVFKPLKQEVERTSRIAETQAKELEKTARAEARRTVQKQATAERKVTTGVEHAGKAVTVDRQRLFKEGLLMDEVWKNYIGGRSVTGRFWGELLKNEQKRGRSGFSLQSMKARDYFQSIAIKWMHEPVKTAKRYPAEVRSIKKIWSQVEEEHGEIFKK